MFIASCSKADIMNLLESAGFSRSNPYYIVKQGKVCICVCCVCISVCMCACCVCVCVHVVCVCMCACGMWLCVGVILLMGE